MKKALVLALVLGVFGLLGCKKSETDVNVVNKVADISLINSTEYVKVKEEYKGKIIVVNFFASWCPPCVDETPDFVKVYNEYKDKDFVIIGISADDDKNAVLKFINKFGINYPVYLSDKAIEKKYMVSKYPTTFVYDKNGKLADIITGMVDGAHLKQIAEGGVN